MLSQLNRTCVSKVSISGHAPKQICLFFRKKSDYEFLAREFVSSCLERNDVALQRYLAEY